MSQLAAHGATAGRRLLLIGPTPPPYHGVSVATQALVGARWRAPFEVMHLDLADRRGIEHVDKPDLHDVGLFLRQWLTLLRILITRRPHLVHVPISQTTIGFLRDSFLIWPALAVRAHVVLHLHGGNFRAWYETRGRLLRAYVRAILRRVASVIVLGESLRELFAGLVPAERLAVVPNGIDWHERAATAVRPQKTRRFRALCLGTLSRNKGTLLMLEAIGLVERQRTDIEFVFAGSWLSALDHREAVDRIARDDIMGAVRFVGPVEGNTKQHLFESADWFVFPGLQQEGQPLVVIEALAAGLPVIYTARGCLRDTVIDGEQGLEIQVGDAPGLAEKILWLADHPQERARMAGNARRRYQTLYTSERFLRNMNELFARIAGADC